MDDFTNPILSNKSDQINMIDDGDGWLWDELSSSFLSDGWFGLMMVDDDDISDFILS